MTQKKKRKSRKVRKKGSGGARENSGRTPKYSEKCETVSRYVPESTVKPINDFIDEVIKPFIIEKNG